MKRLERDDILRWMREHAWNPSPIPSSEVDIRRQSALQMRQRLNDLYDAEGESAAYRYLTVAGRAAGLAGLGILVVDLLTTGGAGDDPGRRWFVVNRDRRRKGTVRRLLHSASHRREAMDKRAPERRRSALGTIELTATITADKAGVHPRSRRSLSHSAIRSAMRFS